MFALRFPELLSYRENRAWRPLRAEDINDYLKAKLGEEFSAKDFRTWNATVLASVSLAIDGRDAGSPTARKRAINRAVKGVAEMLGNIKLVIRIITNESRKHWNGFERESRTS